MGIISSGKSSSNILGLNKQQPPYGLSRSTSNLSLMGHKPIASNVSNHSLTKTTSITPVKDSRKSLSPAASFSHISGKQAGELILFDIRIDKTNDTSYTTPIQEDNSSFANADENFYQDIIIIKGTGQDNIENESVSVSGKVVLSISEPIPIKKLTLRLIGEVKIRIPVGENGLERYSTFDKRISDKSWDYAYFKPYLFPGSQTNEEVDHQMVEDSLKKRPIIQHKRSKSGTNLKKLASFSNLSFSSTSLASLSQGGQSTHDVLQPGNYELPFTFVVPSSTSESLELKQCTVGYKFSCVIERASKKSDLILKKKLKIIRTLSADSIELSETVLISNIWPSKIEYSLSTPAKSNVIGSSIPIRFEFVPLCKRLKLGSIKIQLIEQISVFSPVVGTKNFERVCCKKKVSDPLRSCRYFDEELVSNFYEEIVPPQDYIVEDRGEFLDKWDIIIYLDTPSSLSNISQDCLVGNFVKIRHKLKFVVGLINPDDHVSELRAALPLQFFISPFVPVTAKSFYLDPAFNKNSNPNIDFNTMKDDDIYLFDESKNLLVESVLKAYKVASSEQLSHLAHHSNGALSELNFIDGHLNQKLIDRHEPEFTPDLDTIASSNNEIIGLNQSQTLLPKIKNNSSQHDLFEYSKKHSSVVIADMMVPPDYNKRIYDQLLSENKISQEKMSDYVSKEENGIQTKKNSYSNLDLQRLRYGVSNISESGEGSLLLGSQGEKAERLENDGNYSKPQLNRIPSYSDAMISSNKMQNSNTDISALPPIYNPEWDDEYQVANLLSQPLKNKHSANDAHNDDFDSPLFLKQDTNYLKPQKKNVKAARFQLGVGMTPLNTGGESISVSKENSSKTLPSDAAGLSRNNSVKSISNLFGLGKKS